MVGSLDEDLDALRRLPSRLLSEGYHDAYHVHGAVHTHLEAIARERDALPPSLRALTALFALGASVNRDALGGALPDAEVDALVRLGVLLETSAGLHAGGMVLVPILGQMAFLPAPDVDPTGAFGDDTAALICRMAPPASGRALVPFAGAGVVALRAAAAGCAVVALEEDPVALACAELNAVLNGVERRIELRAGRSVEAVASGERFDYVAANAPLLPFPSDVVQAGPAEDRDGAQDAPTDAAAGLLLALGDLLAPGGRAQIVGAYLGDSEGPGILPALSDMAQRHDLRVHLTVPSRFAMAPGEPVFDALCRRLAVASATAPADVAAAAVKHLAHRRADHLFLAYSSVTHDPERVGVTVTAHYRRGGGFWFR